MAMDATSFLKNLALDVWYKVFVALGAVLFVVSLLVTVKGITNGQLQLISAGMFFVGIGEWKNWRVDNWGGPYLATRPVREPDALGVLFDVVGVVLFLAGLVAIIF